MADTLHELKVKIRASLDGYKKDMAAIKEETKRTKAAVESEKSKINAALNGVSTDRARASIEKLNSTFNRQKEDIRRQEDIILNLKRRYEDLISGVTADRGISGLEKQLKAAEKEFGEVSAGYNKLYDEYEIYQNLSQSGSEAAHFKELSAELERMDVIYEKQGRKVMQLKELLEQAKLNPESTASAEEMIRKIEAETRKLERLKNEAKLTKEKLDAVMLNKAPPITERKVRSITKRLKEMALEAKKSAKSTSSAFSGASNGIEKFGRRIKALLATVLIFNVIRSALTAFRTHMGEALKTNNQFSNSLSQIKGNLSVAFAGIYNATLPAINALMSALASLTAMLATVVSKIFGSTYSQSLKTAKGFKAATAAAGGYKKATERGQVFSFDEVHNINKNEDETGGGGGLSEDVLADLEASDSLLDKFLDKFRGIKEYLDKLFENFKSGFLAGLGDVSFDPLKTALKGIKQSLKDIFTDPDVLKAADNYAIKVAYSLGQMVGAAASIGITTATFLFGGIDKYLAQNKDLIKGWLISNFNIGAEIATLQGDFAQAVANIFSVFGTDTGQQLSANLIGIVANAFMGIQQLAVKAYRDITDILTTPIVINQEDLKEALLGIVGFLAEVTGTIKELVDEAGNILNSVYDEKINPLFASIRDGLGNLLSHFLDFWTGNVKPTLDEWGAKFEEITKDKIIPFVDSIGLLIGSVSNAFTELWNNILQPFIDWIITNILPVILPIADTIMTTALKLVGNISEAIGGIIEVLAGIIDFITGVFTGDWELAWIGIEEMTTGLLEAIVATVEFGLNFISGIVTVGLQLISGTITVAFSTIGSFIATILTTIANVIKTSIDLVKNDMSQGLNIIKEKWVSTWTEVKDTTKKIFDDLWNVIKQSINSILGGIEAMANGVVNGINAVISALNGLNFTVPSWVPGIGGESFSFNIPSLATVSLPRLAKGGIVDRATPLIAGEAGKEAIVPLENNTGWMATLASKIAELINYTKDEPDEWSEEQELTIPITMEIDAEKLDERLVKVRLRRGRPIAVTEG